MVSDKQKVSLICTVLNEGPAIQKLLDSLVSQTRRPDEIIVVDGGSTDDTVAVLRRYAEVQQLPLRVIVAPGANISRGRNIAIEAAAGPVIASTDAGVRLDARWLERLITPFEQASPPQVVSGFFVPDPQSTFEAAMGATVLPLVTDIDPATFLPSSRSVAFLKSSWAAAGRYPEWLDYCEDLIFDFRLRDECGPFGFEPEAVVYFRPRSTLGAFFKQYYRYARGDGKANLWPKRHLVRYLTYLVGLPYILRLIWREKWPGWVLLLLGSGVYCQKPAQRLWSNTWGWRPPSRARAFALIPLIRLVGDVAKMLGYPVGLLWRWRNRELVNGNP